MNIVLCFGIWTPNIIIVKHNLQLSSTGQLEYEINQEGGEQLEQNKL